MREWINLFETVHRVSAYFVILYVAEINDRDDPFEGEVPARIASYEEYELRPFPLVDLHLDGYQFSANLAREYAGMTDEAPPIVIEPNGEIIDGFHRSQAAKLRGDQYIEAYVGIDHA